ncbi:MAG: GIY-YIG nuclease superfamily protein [Microgenomates bacterium OLB23]|nr:MAG: GIY-YIG nuclease superfamily protein [Microgenomates bacterium OLB23]
MSFVYIIKPRRNNRYYVGSTGDIERRVLEHNEGKSLATKYARPWELMFTHKFSSTHEAQRIERKLKSFKSRRILDKIVSTGKIETEV